VLLPLEGEATAALTMYSTLTPALSGEDIENAGSYAGHNSKALRLTVRIAKLTGDRKNLTAAMESTTTVDLCLGVIMAQNYSRETAFKVLRIASNTRTVQLRENA
jgi:hypothetical protein